MTQRLRFLKFTFIFLIFAIIVRLFYWQIVRGFELSSRAATQHQSVATLTANRGNILAADQSLLAGTQDTYQLYAYKPQLQLSSPELIDLLLPVLSPILPPATTSAQLSEEENQQLVKEHLLQRLSLDNSWVSLKNHLTRQQKETVETLNIKGLGFQEQPIRFYPEASMSAHLLGFVGNDVNGAPKGYFGLEGFYQRQLEGREGLMKQETDATGNPILIGQFANYQSRHGRDLLTTINRSYQYQVERLLAQGLQRYGASAGSVIVMDSKSGAILAMASLPSYDPRYFYLFPAVNHKNPAVANLFEPGSVFKPLVMAAAINEGAVEPDATCDSTCDHQIQIGAFTIKTWNDKYYPGSNMTDVLAHSDNTGMVFVARKLGADKLRHYLDIFGFGSLTGIDLQEEAAGLLRPAADWKEIDLATISFGQGIAITPIQLTAAINALANAGQLLPPYLVHSIKESDTFIPLKRSPGKTVLTPQTAKKITQMMVNAVEQGDAKWARPKNIKVAGKTGTAQIPVKGHYDEEKTIASFVGFVPADQPKFTMLVTLREPQTSPWGSETAAPLWFEIAKQLLLLN